MATQNFKNWWAGLTPEKRRIAMGIASLTVLLLLVYLFLQASPNHQPKRASEAHSDTNLLTGSDARTLGMDAVGAELREAQRKQRELQGALQRLQEQTVSKDDLKALSSQLSSLSQMVGTLNDDKHSGHPDGSTAGRLIPTGPAGGVAGAKEPVTLDPTQAAPGASFETTSSADFLQKSRTLPSSTPEPLKVGVYGESEPQAANRAKDSGNPAEEVYLPAGSIISGVLLTGVDAPTGMQAKRDPVPALMRIKHEAILPGRYNADLRECFMVLAVTGDLSTERGLMRAETLSCVRQDGGVVEATIDGYGLGDDGKAGVRGRLVARNGALVAKAAFASFAEALSQIFRPVAIQGLNTSPTSRTEFQAPNTSQALEASGYAGVGGAMHRLSEYFVSLADQIVPFVEIDAARPVEAVLLKGVVLKLRSAPK